MSHMAFTRNGAYVDGNGNGTAAMIGVEASDDAQVAIHVYVEKLDDPKFSFYLEPADARLIRSLLTSAADEAD